MRGSLNRIRREHDRVVNLAHYPFFDPVDELRRGDFCCPAIDKPGIGQSTVFFLSMGCFQRRVEHSTYRPADIVGHVLSLQIG